MERIGPTLANLMEPYKHTRRVRCQSCLAPSTVTVTRQKRLRTRKCPCGGRLRAANWRGFL